MASATLSRRSRRELPRIDQPQGDRDEAPACPTSITSDIAAPSGQFAALVKKSWIRLPYIEPALPPTRSGVTYSPTVGMKHMKKPAITPGRLKGRATRQKRCSGVDPRSAAASKSVGSIRCRPARMGSATNGIQT